MMHSALLQPVAHLTWEKGVCQEGQLLISLFSIKPHFLLNTGNRPMKFAMLPKNHIGKIMPTMQYISNIFS